jgi:hypothetical protein
MDTFSNPRAEKIHDFFHLKPPKQLSLEYKLKMLAALMVFFPAAKLITGNGIIAFALLGVVIFFLFLFWFKPRADKRLKYNQRIAPETLNNWLIESFKTKIIDRAIAYLEIDTNKFKPEQYIIIPYPVFHSTRKIEDDQILREKTEYIPQKNSIEKPVCYYNYSFWNIQVLILSKNFISYYFCSYNWIKDEILNEKSNEYFYQDIALIKTSQEEVNFISKWQEQPISEARVLKLIHYSGDVLQLIADIPELQQSPQTLVDLEKIEKTLRILMRHVRAKDESKKQVGVEFKDTVMAGETVEI